MRKIGLIHTFLHVNICCFPCICVHIFGNMLVCGHLRGSLPAARELATVEKVPVTSSPMSDHPLFLHGNDPTTSSETQSLGQVKV